MLLLPLLLAAQAATITINNCPNVAQVQAPNGDVTLTCNAPPTPPPAPPPSSYAACAAAGYTARPVAVPWPLLGNTSGQAPTFGNADAIVVSFTTPAAGAAVFQPAGFPPTQGTMRLYTLGTSPCLFAGPGGAGIVGQTPAFNLSVGPCTGTPFQCAGKTVVLPNTTYYVTMVNRGGFAGTPQYLPSCSGNCPMRLDFSHGN